MNPDAKAVVLLIVALMFGVSIAAGFESWADVERARHGCTEKK